MIRSFQTPVEEEGERVVRAGAEPAGVLPWARAAEAVGCWEPGAPQASPRSPAEVRGWVGWQHLSFSHTWSGEAPAAEVPVPRLRSEPVSRLGSRGGLQSGSRPNAFQGLLLVGDEYDEVQRRRIFKRVR